MAVTRATWLALLLLPGLLLAGCGMMPSRSRGRAAIVPQPRPAGPVESGVRTLSLRYALPELKAEPALMSWTNIEIEDVQPDGTRRPCIVWSVTRGRNAEGLWTSISFMFPPDSRKIVARLILRIDSESFPLNAIFTREDPTHWRVDYGIDVPKGK